MINNIIFDFDGIIVDSEVLASRALSVFFCNLGYSFKEEFFFKYAGIKTVEVIDRLSREYNIKDKKKFSSDIYNLTNKIFENELMTVDGFKEFIVNSKKKHFIGSNSNKDRIIRGLNIVEMSKYFNPNIIYSFDMVKKPKPHPDVYLKVIKDNSLNINETIIIEDSGIGVKAANSAGVRVFGLTAGKHWHINRNIDELYDNGALNVFSSYNDLEKAIEGL